MQKSVWSVVLFAACTGSSAAPLTDDPAPVRAPAPATDHRTIALPGDSHGAIWDAAAHALLLTDDTHSTIVRWTERAGFERVANIPPAARVALGGLVRISDTRLLVASFGFGVDGGIIALAGDPARELTAAALPNIDPQRRRLAVSRPPGFDTVFVSYFTARAGTRPRGGVARLDPATGVERDIITGGLGKPVGLAATSSTLYVADADARAIYAYPIQDPRSRTALAKDLAGADLLELLPDGTLVTGGNGSVQRITPAGAVSTIAGGFEQVRGTAYDPEGHRLFVVEHSAASSRHTLHVLPFTVH